MTCKFTCPYAEGFYPILGKRSLTGIKNDLSEPRHRTWTMFSAIQARIRMPSEDHETVGSVAGLFLPKKVTAGSAEKTMVPQDPDVD